jgi:hypothetical protein
MRTLALVVLLAAVLAWPLVSYAEDQGGWQLHDPNEYQQEDSHPVRIIGYLLSPVGFALEWGIARPLHYLATNTPLAPVLNGGKEEDSWTEYYGSKEPIAEVPIPQSQIRGSSSASQQAVREQDLGYRSTAPAAAAGTRSYTPNANPSQPGAPPYQGAQGQAILH